MKKSTVWFGLSFIFILIIAIISPGQWLFKSKEKLILIEDNIKVEKKKMTIFGILTPIEIIEKRSQVSGKVIRVHVRPNDKVKKGKILAELDQSSIKERIKQTERDIEILKIALEKIKLRKQDVIRKIARRLALYKSGLISKESIENIEISLEYLNKDIESLKARIKQAESQLKAANIDLDHTIIRSEIDGVVLERKTNPGETVISGFQPTTLFIIASLGRMQIQCNVDENYLKEIKEGDQVKFSVAYLPGQEFIGIIEQIRLNPKIVDSTAKYPIIISVDNTNMKLIPGIAKVEILKK